MQRPHTDEVYRRGCRLAQGSKCRAAGASAQQMHELQRLQREEREQLLRDAGIAPKVLCALGAGLALQADLHMPWHKLRKLCRWLSSFGVSLESESTMSQQISQQLPFTVSAELVLLTTKSGATELKPEINHSLFTNNEAPTLVAVEKWIIQCSGGCGVIAQQSEHWCV